MKFFVVLFVLFVVNGSCLAYVFDKRSCDNMMPSLNLLTATTTVSSSAETTGETSTATARPEEENVDTDVLSRASDPSLYKITTNVQKYRRNRLLTVTVDGPEFNGMLMQARQYVSDGDSSPALIGTFVNLPPGIQTLDCDRGPSFSVANTAFSRDTGVKKGLELKWRAPPDDVGSIQFVATVIQDQTYWSHIKSAPLLFNDFPPSLSGCGKDHSCFRYAQVHENCDDGKCSYLVVSRVVDDYVVFTIGGKVQGDRGYVGLGFTTDKDKLTFIDMCVCMKQGPQQVDTAHYMVTDQSRKPVKHHEELEDEETDIDGEHIWCRFRRPLRIQGSQAADLTQSLFQVFLWGPLDSETGAPELPRYDDIVRVTETWNHTQTMNVVHLVGGADIARLSWLILFAVLVATLVELH